MRLSRLLFLFIVLCPGFAVAEEGRGDERIVATVNNAKISLAELDTFARLAFQSGSFADTSRSTLLKQLVFMRLIQQKSEKEPSFLNDQDREELDLARLQALRGLYLEHFSERMPPRKVETQKFIEGHPQYFADRHLFFFEELKISGNNRLTQTALLAAMQAPQDRSNGTDSEGPEAAESRIAAYSEGRGSRATRLIAYAEGRGAHVLHRQEWKFSEELDDETLKQLSRMKENEAFVGETTNKDFRILVLHGAQSIPVQGLLAERLASQAILSRRKLDLSNQLFARLAASAKIDFTGKVAPPAEALMASRQIGTGSWSAIPAVPSYVYLVGAFLLLVFGDRLFHLLGSAQRPSMDQRETLTARFRSYRWCLFFAGITVTGGSLIVSGDTMQEWLVGVALSIYGLQGLFAEFAGIKVYESYIVMPRRWAQASPLLVMGRTTIYKSEIVQPTIERSGLFGDIIYLPKHAAPGLTPIISLMNDDPEAVTQAIFKAQAGGDFGTAKAATGVINSG